MKLQPSDAAFVGDGGSEIGLGYAILDGSFGAASSSRTSGNAAVSAFILA